MSTQKNASAMSWRRLGARMDRDAPERRTSAMMIALGTFALTMIIAFVGILIGSYQERLERDYSRVPASWFTAAEKTNEGARWQIISDSAGDHWVHVIVIVPGNDAPLPPGLSRWPEPGDVVLSPGLKDSSIGHEIVQRYGQEAPGVIGASGVVSSTERLAYVRPENAVLSQVYGLPLTDFGAPFPAHPGQEGFLGGAAYQRSLEMALLGYGLTFVIPSLILMMVSSRTGSARRDRRLQVLAILGAAPRDSSAVLWGAVGRPLIVGGVGAALALSIVAAMDVPVPGPDVMLRSQDVRAQLPIILLCALTGWLASVGIVMLGNRPRRARGTRPRRAIPREKWWKILLLPVVCVVTTQALIATLSWEDATPRILLIYVGIALVALTLPAFVGAATFLLARLLVRLGRAAGNAACIVAGRQLLHDPRAVRRLASGMALIIVLMAHSLVLANLTNSQTRHAEAVHSVFGSSILEVTGNVGSEAQTTLLSSALDGHGGVLAISVSFDNGRVGPAVVTASCPVLAAVNLACTNGRVDPAALEDDGRLYYLVTSLGADDAVVDVGDPWSADESLLYAVSYDGEDLPASSIRAELAHTMLPPPSVYPVGQSWVDGLQEARDQAQWNIVGAAAATVLLGLAVTGSVLGDTGAHSRRVGVTSMWGAGRRFAAVVVAGRVLLPLLVAVGTGGLAALVTTYPLTMPPLDSQLPSGYFTATMVLPLVAAVLVTIVGIRSQFQQLSAWRPGAER